MKNYFILKRFPCVSFVAIEGHQRICVQKNVSGTVSDETEGESKERCRIYILAFSPSSLTGDYITLTMIPPIHMLLVTFRNSLTTKAQSLHKGFSKDQADAQFGPKSVIFHFCWEMSGDHGLVPAWVGSPSLML